jgi:ATP-dependent DNA ligase
MMLRRENDRVRLITKGGLDWTRRYPWIVESALKIRSNQFILDGETVVLGASMACPIFRRCTPASMTTRRILRLRHSGR